MDKIHLEHIRLEIRVGVTEEEQSMPQPCGLDLELSVKLGPAGKSGDLHRSVDYAAVFRCVEEICSRKSYTLLEEIAEQICCEILDRYRIQAIRVKVRKLQPFSPKLEAVGVEVHRKRAKMKK